MSSVFVCGNSGHDENPCVAVFATQQAAERAAKAKGWDLVERVELGEAIWSRMEAGDHPYEIDVWLDYKNETSVRVAEKRWPDSPEDTPWNDSVFRGYTASDPTYAPPLARSRRVVWARSTEQAHQIGNKRAREMWWHALAYREAAEAEIQPAYHSHDLNAALGITA